MEVRPLMIIGACDPRKGELYQVLDETARVTGSASLPSAEMLKRWYADMVRLRAIDDKIFMMQRAGRMHTYPQIRGHEAIQVGAAHAMKPADWLVPSYREGGMVHLRGVPYSKIMLFWLGNEQGSSYPPEIRILPFAIPIASQLPHAVGLAWGAKLRGDKAAVVVTFGDGATSEGEFHEAMNFAGVFKVPVVFLCTNNQWAISVPRTQQTASTTIAEKAFAYGFDGIQVDGMDVIAIHSVVSEALEKARSGGGPTLIEALTYRLCDHTTADDASLYQDAAETACWREKDGVERLKRYLLAKKLWSDADELRLQAEAKAFVETSIAELEASTPPTPHDIFASTYATMTPRLTEQLAELTEFVGEGAAHHG